MLLLVPKYDKGLGLHSVGTRAQIFVQSLHAVICLVQGTGVV